MELIIFIIIIAIVVNSAKKNANGAKKPAQPNVQRRTNTDWTTAQGSGTSRYTTGNTSNHTGTLEPWQEAARANIEKAKARANQVVQMTLNELEIDSSGETEDDPWFEADQRRARIEELRKKALERAAQKAKAANTTILERAVEHADGMKQDVTLETMEAEHQHSERVSTTVHTHPEDIIPENMLGKLDDLMIKGYDGNLCFERDFVGEGLDMIARFTPPTEVPDFSI